MLRKIYFFILGTIVLSVVIFITIKGSSFYNTSISERFYHPDYLQLKPSGVLGHGFGIAGSLLMVFGVLLYQVRKRVRMFHRLGLLKYWLEIHIFMCTLGPILILYHTSFKFGGLVAISFWSMVAVFASGIIGRFIYLQIPRTIEGRELSLNEVRLMKGDLELGIDKITSGNNLLKSLVDATLKSHKQNSSGSFFGNFMSNFVSDFRSIAQLKNGLRSASVSPGEIKSIVKLVKNERSISRKINRLNTMQNLFKYWHVAHLPFALVMLIIMIIHIAVTIIMGYRWVF
jgi:preprotein translocase subunit Sec61beta